MAFTKGVNTHDSKSKLGPGLNPIIPADYKIVLLFINIFGKIIA